MKKQMLKQTILAALVGVGLAACADAPQAPLGPSAPTAPSLATNVGPSNVVGLRWRSALDTAVTASATIGVFGGRVDVPSLGTHLVVPPGAVLEPTRFAITALPGRLVAFDFEPAGSRFVVPLLLTQEKKHVTGVAPSIVSVPTLGYFASDAALNQSLGTAVVSELARPLAINALGDVTFPVWHFSGYIVSWGRN